MEIILSRATLTARPTSKLQPNPKVKKAFCRGTVRSQPDLVTEHPVKRYCWPREQGKLYALVLLMDAWGGLSVEPAWAQ